MAHVGISVSKGRRTFSSGEFGRGWDLSFDAELARPWMQNVELTSDEKFKYLPGHVGFVDSDARRPEYEGHDVGTLSYSKGSKDMFYGSPPAFYVTLRLSRDDLHELLSAASAGQPLRSINIDVPKLGYGWAPDGSEMKWDNVTNPSLPIDSFRLFFGEPEEEEIVLDPVPLADPGPAFTRQDLELSRLVATSRYTLYALCALILIELWTRH